MAEQCKGSTSPAPEPEDMTTFLNQVLLHSSSTSSSKFVNHNAFSSPPLTTADVSSVSHFPDRLRHGGGGHSVADLFDAGGGYKFPGDNGVLKWRCNENDVADYLSGGKTEEGTVEGASDAVRTRSSSKRSRAAEVHNLSEKRRRSRINEKMKALQKLIPNSNKTDKASMLDEAIEYLKQLQLQVQMLTLRNGMALHPMSLPGLHLMQFPIPVPSIDEGSSGLFNATNMVTASSSANEESLVQTVLNLPNQWSVSNQPITMLSGRNMNVPETTFSYEQLTQLHNQPCNLSTAAKDICREGTPHARLDQTMNTSSSSVS